LDVSYFAAQFWFKQTSSVFPLSSDHLLPDFVLFGHHSSFTEPVFWRSFSPVDIHLLGIAAFYGLVVFLQNYNSELVYGFRQVAVQGRYLFPVIGGINVLFTQSIKGTPVKFLRISLLFISLGLFLLGGPLTFLINSQTFLSSWLR
jgi:hypothetical protein